jgi:ankyrin repeat protein
MPLTLGPNALLRASEAEVPWYENPNDTGALDRVYNDSKLIPAYEYPAFHVNDKGALVQAPEHEAARFQPFKKQFESLCATLVMLNEQFKTPQVGDKPNIEIINKFRTGILCGFTNDTSTKYSHQEADLFKEIKYNLEVILNAVIKNKDEKTFKDVLYVIAMCEGGVAVDFNRIKRALVEPKGRSQYLQAERGRIVGALAQAHIAKAKKNKAPIPIGLQTHVEILFTKALELMDVPLPQLIIRDANIPILVKDEAKGLVFENDEAAIISVENYDISITELNVLKKDFDRMYAESIAESMTNHLNEQLENQCQIYQNEVEELKPKSEDLKKREKQLENELALAKGVENADERLRIRSLLKMIESEMSAPLDKFMSELKNMMDAYGLPDFSFNFIIDYNDESNIALQKRDSRLYYLFSAVNANFEADNILSGFEKTKINDDYILVTDGSRQWVLDKENNPCHLHDFLETMDESSWGPFVSALKDPVFLKILLSAMNDETLKPDRMNLLKDSYYKLRYFENKNDLNPLLTALNNKIPQEIDQLIQWSIDHGKDLNIKDYNGNSSLIWAAMNGHKDIVLSLIRGKANVFITDNAGGTALILAAYYGHTEIAKALLQAGGLSLAKLQDKNGATAIHYAAAKGRKVLVEALLQTGGGVLASMKDSNGKTGLHIAAKRGHTEIVKALLEIGGSELASLGSNEGSTALHWAASFGQTDIVKALLQIGGSELACQKNQSGSTALHYAAENSHAEAVKTLLQIGGSALAALKDNSGRTAVVAAIVSDQIDTAKTILLTCGKSIAAGPPFNIKLQGWISLNDIPYTREGYIQDENKDQLLLKEYANLEVLFRDLASEAGLGENALPDEEKLYLYALAFQAYAKRTLSRENPHLKLVDTFISVGTGQPVSAEMLVSAIRSAQQELKNSVRYKFGKFFSAPVTIYEDIPAIVGLKSTAGLRAAYSPNK